MGRLITGAINPTVLYVSGGNTQVCLFSICQSGKLTGIFSVQMYKYQDDVQSLCSRIQCIYECRFD